MLGDVRDQRPGQAHLPGRDLADPRQFLTLDRAEFLKVWQMQPWPITVIPFVGQVHIAQFQETSIESAKEKLLQFPQGSAFEWIRFGQEGEQKAFDEMSQFANEHGLKLTAKNVQQ